MVLATISSGLYKLLFLGHVVTFVVAFAAAVIHPVMTAQARADGEGQLQRLAGYMAVNGRRIHFPALVLTAGFGIGLILVSDDVWEFSQTWISLAFLVWIAMCGLVSGMIMPAERKVAAGDMAAEKRIELGGQIVTVLTIAMLYLMIWKPGL